MSVRVFYGDFEFIPAPILNWQTTYLKDGKLDNVGIQHVIGFDGIFLELAGESGNFSSVMGRRQSLSDALASGNQDLVITQDGTTVLSGVFPKITDLSFEGDPSPQGTWADRLNYTFNASYVEDFYGTPVQSFTEAWNFEEADDRRTVNVTHNISAVGMDTSGSGINNAVTNARTFVLGRVGYGNVPPSHPAFATASGTATGFEGSRTESVDVAGGSVSVNEQFILSSGNYTHVQEATYEEGDDGITTVGLQGTLQGLGRGDVAFARALDGFTGNVRPKLPANASGVYDDFGGGAELFTSQFNNYSLTQNKFLGTITYSAQYTDDVGDNLPSGVKEFDISVADNEPIRLFASFPIFERTLGNVVQDVATPTEGTFSITGSTVGKQDFAFSDLKNFVQDRINALRPLPANYITLRMTQQQVTENEDAKTLQWSLQWTYTKSLSEAATTGPVIID